MWGFDLPYLAYRLSAGLGPVPFDLIIVHLKPIALNFLDKNLFEIHISEIHKAKVIKTFFLRKLFT